jgi:hypothetical protein
MDDLVGKDPVRVSVLTGGYFVWEPGDMTRYQLAIFPMPERFGAVMLVNLMSLNLDSVVFQQIPVSWKDIEKGLKLKNLVTIYQFTQAVEVVMGWTDPTLQELANTLRAEGYLALADRHR